MNLYGNLVDEKAISGLLFGVTPKDIVSRSANEEVAFGRGLFASSDKDCTMNKSNNKAVVDLKDVTTNEAKVELEINGVSLEVTYAGTDASENKTAVINAINSNETLTEEEIVASEGADSTKIVVETSLAMNLAISGTANDTAVTVTSSSTQFFAGVAVFTQTSFKDSRGVYPAKDTVNVLEKGKIWVEVKEGISTADGVKAYVTSDGFFTTESDNNVEVGYFRSEASNNIALVEIRGIKA